MLGQGALGTATGASVPVSFYTTTFHAHLPQQVLTVPITVLPQGLNEIVNTLLALDPPVPFDFLVKDEYVTTTLDRFMRRRGISAEETLQLEYTPAMQAKEGNKLPHDDWVSSVRAPVCGQSSLLVTAAYDRCVRLWNGEECLAVGSGHTEAVKEIALHPHRTAAAEGKVGKKRSHAPIGNFTFASASKDGSVMAWAYDDATLTIKAIGSVKQHLASVDTVDISPDGALLATGSWDKTVKVFGWEAVLDHHIPADKKAPLAAFTDHARAVLSVRWSPNQAGVLYSTGLDGAVKTWDASRAQLMGTLVGEHAAQSISAKPSDSKSADLLLTGGSDNRVRLYDTRQKTVAKTFTGHRQWVYGVTWLWREEDQTTSNCFATSSEDSTVRVWDLRCPSAALITQDHLHTDGVLDVTYCGQNEIASGGKDNKTKTFAIERNVT